MKRLDDFVRDHKEEFDMNLPSPELWGKIEKELNGKARITFSWWKMASAVAAILVVAVLSTIFINRSTTNKINDFANITDPELRNLLETEAYYAGMVSGKMTEIQKCYNIYPELKMDIESDLNELDNMYRDLQNDLNDNVYNREVIEAMIQNNRLKLEMVNRVLDQINC